MEIKKQSKFLQGSVLRKIEGSPVLINCKIWGTQHTICMKKLRLLIPSPPKAKVRCLLHIYVTYTAILRKVVAKTVHATITKGNMGYDQ